MNPIKLLATTAAIILVTALTALAQQPPPPYGAPMSLDAAKKAMTAAEAEAKKNNWPVAIAILDTTGSLVMLQKLDNTQTGSVDIAINKARTALDFRRPSKALQDVVAGGGAGLRLLSARNMLTLEGGVPVIVDGKVVGAVGVSGVTSEQDAQVAMAGAAAAKQLPRQRSFAWVPVIDSGAAYARHCESAPDAQQCLAPPFAAW
jgi:glc operon protein GlcG